MPKLKYQHLIITALFIFTLGNSARAGILIEPYFGYIFNGSMEEDFGGETQEYSHTGTGYGGRLGYSSILGPMIGFQYDKSSIETEVDSPASGEGNKDDWDTTNMGIFAGYQFPVLLRVWGTYHFSSEMEDQDDTGHWGNSGAVWSGSGYSFGAGYTGFPFLSINLEYRSFEYDEQENSDGETTQLPGDFAGLELTEREVSEVFLSVSFPLNI